MNLYNWAQLIFYFVVLLAMAKPLGRFMAKHYWGEYTFPDRFFGQVEQFVYHRDSEIQPQSKLTGRHSVHAVLPSMASIARS